MLTSLDVAAPWLTWRMHAQDVYKIGGIGTVPVGRVETGVIKVRAALHALQIPMRSGLPKSLTIAIAAVVGGGWGPAKSLVAAAGHALRGETHELNASLNAWTLNVLCLLCSPVWW